MTHEDFVIACGLAFILGLGLLALGFAKVQGRKLDRMIGYRRAVNGDITGRYKVARMNINGVEISGSDLNITNGRILVDGVDQTDTISGGKDVGKIVEVRILEGTLEQLYTTASVTCNDVTGSVDAGGSVSCGNVGGNVECGGSLRCADIAGSVDAGGSVRCGKVGGSVEAGGSLHHG